jgi:hypothetical protein
MKERPIWRPNAIPADEWEAMSREEQIACWKANREPPSPKRHMSQAIRYYEEGNLTQSEFCLWVIRFATRQEIEEFVAQCPSELMSVLKDYLGKYGEDESRWPRTYCMRSYFPWTTPEEIEESERREHEQIWSGVRLLKQSMG